MNKCIYLVIIGLMLVGCEEQKQLNINAMLLNKSINDNSIELNIKIKNISSEKVAIQNPMIGFNMHFELITDRDTLFYFSNASPSMNSSNYLVLDKDQIYEQKLSINRFGLPVEGSNEFRLQENEQYEYVIYYMTENEYFNLIVNDKEGFFELYGFDPDLIIKEKYTIKGIID